MVMLVIQHDLRLFYITVQLFNAAFGNIVCVNLGSSTWSEENVDFRQITRA